MAQCVLELVKSFVDCIIPLKGVLCQKETEGYRNGGVPLDESLVETREAEKAPQGSG